MNHKILITGWPGSGKTTLAAELCQRYGLLHYCTDPQTTAKNPGLDIMYVPGGLEWSQGSQFVVDNWLDMPSYVIEGNAIPRVLRKWRKANPKAPFPADRLILLNGRHRTLIEGQRRMGLGHDTVLKEIWPWVKKYVQEDVRI